MKKRLIKLTENYLKQIIKESVNKILTENDNFNYSDFYNTDDMDSDDDIEFSDDFDIKSKTPEEWYRMDDESMNEPKLRFAEMCDVFGGEPSFILNVLKKYATDEDYTKWSEWLEQEQDLELDRKEQMYK